MFPSHDRGGRQLGAIASTNPSILDSVLAEANQASVEPVTWLFVSAGGNDMLNNGKNAAQLLEYDQAIYDWCAEKGIYYLKANMPPISSAAAWQPSMAGVTANYNSSLASNPFGEYFKVVDIFSVLDDPVTSGQLDPAIDSGDGVHPTYSSDYSVTAGADRIINEVKTVIDTLTPMSILSTIGISGTDQEILDKALSDQGFTGTLNDKIYSALSYYGYTGALSDMLQEYLIDYGDTGALADMLARAKKNGTWK